MNKSKRKALDLLIKMDNELGSFFNKMDDLKPEQLEKRNSNDSWSVLEVLQHLNVTESTSYAYVKYKVDQGSKFEKNTLKTRFRGWSLIMFFILPVKIKAPNVAGLNPINEKLDYDQIKSNWLSTREGLAKLLDGLDDSVFNEVAYKHPVAGRVTLSYMLKFFDVHIKRHEKQINKILAY